jgi:hypothetical protein
MGDTMALIDQTIAALDSGITLDDLDRLPPATLRRFAALCQHWHLLADARMRPRSPQVGVLAALNDGRGRS